MLSDEARNTERHHLWVSDLKLRHSRVAFISVGKSTAEDLNPIVRKSEIRDEATEGSFQESTRAAFKIADTQSTTHAMVPDGPMSNMTLKDLRSPPDPQAKSGGLGSISQGSSIELGLRNAEASNEILFPDLESTDGPVHTSPSPPIITRSPSPTGSGSSADVIVFVGRRHPCIKGDQKDISDTRSRVLNGQGAQDMSRPSTNRNLMATVKDNPKDVKMKRFQSSPKQRSSSLSPSTPESALGHLSGNSRATATKTRRRRRERHIRKRPKDEGVLDDYVKNTRGRGCLEALVENSTFNQRDLGGFDTAEWQNDVESFTKARVGRDPLTNRETWDSADLTDFDELSTSNEALDSIEQILSKRERPSGVQYLIIGAGYTIDDARWFPLKSLNVPDAEALIQEFEDKAELKCPFGGNNASDASLTTDEQVAQGLQDDSNHREEKINIVSKGNARMTDEQIANLLSKQEELELGSNDSISFDVDDAETDSEEDLPLDGLWEQAVTHRTPSKSKRTTQSRSNFPSATAFADVLDQDLYNGFDVMDQERPSLRKRPKGRRGKLYMELSDSELEQSIQTAWEKDRTKKKLRKQEREELRTQGLLGKRLKLNLKAKYSGGISMTEVKEEIMSFLLSSKERYVS